eukprot:755175-Hanusia_phi.AAC.3
MTSLADRIISVKVRGAMRGRSPTGGYGLGVASVVRWRSGGARGRGGWVVAHDALVREDALITWYLRGKKLTCGQLDENDGVVTWGSFTGGGWGKLKGAAGVVHFAYGVVKGPMEMGRVGCEEWVERVKRRVDPFEGGLREHRLVPIGYAGQVRGWGYKRAEGLYKDEIGVTTSSSDPHHSVPLVTTPASQPNS